MKLKFLFGLLLAGTLTAGAQGYQDGVDNYNAGRFDIAQTILLNNINNPSTDKAVAYYYLGNIAFQDGNVAEAKADFQKGIAADPANGYNYIGLGQVALKEGNKSEAEAQFKEGINTNKKDAALLAAVARAYYNVDPTVYSKQINDYIAKAFKLSKNTEPAVYMLQGDMKADENPGEAAGLYEMAIMQSKNRGEVNREAYVKYASTYFKVNPKFAIERLVELNELEPNSALAQRELAEKYYDNNQFGSACIQYGKYMENPNHFQKDEQRYAGLLYSAKEYDQSLAIANKVLSEDPENFYMYRIILLDMAALENWAAAEEAGNKLFSLAGDKVIANDYIVYGNVLSEQGKNQEAVDVFVKAVELNPDKPELLPQLSAIYEKAGMNDKAVDTMKQYLDGGNGTTNDIVSMARRYDALARSLPEGDPARVDAATEGIKYIDMAIAKVPNNGTLYRIKGQLILSQNDNKPNAAMAEAYEKMISCYNEDPSNKQKYASSYAAADYLLALYYLEIDPAKAKEYFQDYLTINPDDEQVRNMVEAME
ncbi:MAG: tetratricopeptide repeat protein [Bacteroidales bacterium]|nr:tetratricopeptide repeat protein [Bacteroidales bacterium]